MLCLEDYRREGHVVLFDPVKGEVVDPSAAPSDPPQGFLQRLDEQLLAIFASQGRLFVWANGLHEVEPEVAIEHLRGELGDPCSLVIRRGTELVAKVTYPDPRRNVPLVDMAFGFDVEDSVDLGAFIAHATREPRSRAYHTTSWSHGA